jgi:aspartate carbamoyltransferase catalytic subunit
MPKFRHLTQTTGLDRSWIESELFPLCETFRANRNPDPILNGFSLYCLFYEPSFITRTSFERAMDLLGGRTYLTEDASQFFPVTTPNYVDNVIDNLASLLIDVVVLRSSDLGVMARAEAADAMPVISGGSEDDHPTQALADIYTLQRELGGVDGVNVGIVGRLEHRNVNALLSGLAMFDNIKVTLVPSSGQVDPKIMAHCEQHGVKFETHSEIEAVEGVDAIYLNSPRTVAHIQLLRSRGALNLRIDEKFMSMLKPGCIILDPMQRSGDFSVEVHDERLAFYRQAQNALYVRMAVLAKTLGK